MAKHCELVEIEATVWPPPPTEIVSVVESGTVPVGRNRLGATSSLLSVVGVILILSLMHPGGLEYAGSVHRFLFITSDDDPIRRTMGSSVACLSGGLIAGILGCRSRPGKIGLSLAAVGLAIWADALLVPYEIYH